MADQRVRSIGKRAYRAGRIASTFGRIYLGIKVNQVLARRLGKREMERRWQRFNRRSAESIFRTAVELRGLILKACQFIGSRPDVLPAEYIDVLSQLQDRVPPLSHAEIRRVVEEELGAPLESAFSYFSEESIASASLAQVHEARLHDGSRVAVKVQYPEIGELVRSDLSNLEALFRAVGLVERDFDLMPLVEELGQHLPRELDFFNEGMNAERVSKFIEHRDDLLIPRVHWQLTTTRVLVTDFVDGIKINDTAGLEAAGIDKESVMRSLLEGYCEQILVHGFFHADPHPGNLMVLPSQGKGERHRVVFVDFGLCKQLPATFRQGGVQFAAALLGGDPEAMGKALVDLGFETRGNSRVALHEISKSLLAVAKRLRGQTYIDPEIIREAGDDLPRLIRQNPVLRVPGHVVLLGRVFGLLSGLGRSLGVKLDMLETILPFASGRSPDTGSRVGRP